MPSKFATINGPTSIPVFCAKLTEIAENIEHIACVVQYKDQSTEVLSSHMSSGDVAWLRWVFDQDFRPEHEEEQ
jgi:hypothetical protein